MRKTLIAAALGGVMMIPAVGAKEGQPKVYTGVAPAPASAAEREIVALFDRWNAALASGDPRRVAALYAPNGVLQPTVSNQVRSTPAEIEAYFVDFLKAKPAGVINERFVRLLDEDTAMDSGVYTFTLTKNGQPTKVQARYTYLYQKIDGDWKIVNHHSSAMPEPIPAQVLAKLG
jgi:uncharacterized protein (TIGR02246 family)